MMKSILFYFVHAHGNGHRATFNLLYPALSAYFKVIAITTNNEITRYLEQKHELQVLELPPKYPEGYEPPVHTFSKAFEVTPYVIEAAGRAKALAEVIQQHQPIAFYCDGVPELAIMVRGMGVPVVLVHLPGNIKDDPTQVFAHELADHIVAHFPASLEQTDYPYGFKTFYSGYLSQYADSGSIPSSTSERTTLKPSEVPEGNASTSKGGTLNPSNSSVSSTLESGDTSARPVLEPYNSSEGSTLKGSDNSILNRVTILLGYDNYDVSVLLNITQDQQTQFTIIGNKQDYDLGENCTQLGRVKDISKAIAGNIVISAAGQNTIAELLSLGKHLILLPEPRPYDEQLVHARVLADQHIALLADENFSAEQWKNLLQQAQTFQPLNPEVLRKSPPEALQPDYTQLFNAFAPELVAQKMKNWYA